MDPQLDEPDLRSYLGVLNRRKWWVVGITVAMLGLALLFSLLATPVYRAKAIIQTMAFNDPIAYATGQDRSGPTGERIAQAELAYLRGTTLRFAAMAAVPENMDPSPIASIDATPILSADINQTSSVVQLTLDSSDPDEAANLLQIFAGTYVAERTAESQTRLVEAISLIEAEENALTDEIAKLRRPITELQNDLADARAANDAARIEDISGRLDRATAEASPAIGNKQSLITQLETKVDNLKYGIGFTNGTGAQVIATAHPSKTPVSPNFPANIGIGLVFGLMLGIAAAFLRDYFDDSVKTKEQVERATGVPALGLIPKFDTQDSELVTAAFPTSPAAEAFRSLRTSVKFLSVDREVRVVQVTSPSPGEGKTVVAANLATVFAQAGDRVVLVGGDLRRPRAEELLGVSLTPGLTGVLIGEVSLPQAIRPVDGVPNLSVLPAGMPPPNPSELLSGERARRLVDVLAQTYDLVVLDCPPVLPVTDALVLARMADTTLLVTSVNKTSRRGLDRTVELLEQVGAPLVGVVMSSLSRDATYGTEPYGYESVSPRRKGYDRAYDGLSGYGSFADTNQAPAADMPLAGQTSNLPAVPGNDQGQGQGLWPSELPGRG